MIKEISSNDLHARYYDDNETCICAGLKDFLIEDFINFYTRFHLVIDLLIPYYKLHFGIYNGFKMKLGRTGYLMGFIRTYAHR